MKKSIGDIALNVHGSQIAIVENQGGYDSVEESAVRIYNVGRKRNEDNNAVSDVTGILIEVKLINFLNFLQEDEEDDDEDSEEDDSESLGSQDEDDFNTMEGTGDEGSGDDDGDQLQNIIRSLLQR